MWQFANLKKLQLDNNIIEEISGLDTLTQLEWLDLSFNNIEEISGLERLVNLKDLSLANNRITTIENLDALVGSLQILSVANNLITDLKNVSLKLHHYFVLCFFFQVEYLRKFGKLQTLALKGNPLSDLQDYIFHVVAYIPCLAYIDFRIVLADEVMLKEKFVCMHAVISCHLVEAAGSRDVCG